MMVAEQEKVRELEERRAQEEQGEVISWVGRVTVMLGAVVYCRAGITVRVKFELVQILGTDKVRDTEVEAGVQNGLWLAWHCDAGFPSRSVLVMVQTMLPRYFLGLARLLSTTMRGPRTVAVTTLEATVKLSTKVVAELAVTPLLLLIWMSAGRVMVNFLELLDEMVTEGSVRVKVVVEAKVGLLLVIVTREGLGARRRGAEPLPIGQQLGAAEVKDKTTVLSGLTLQQLRTLKLTQTVPLVMVDAVRIRLLVLQVVRVSAALEVRLIPAHCKVPQVTVTLTTGPFPMVNPNSVDTLQLVAVMVVLLVTLTVTVSAEVVSLRLLIWQFQMKREVEQMTQRLKRRGIWLVGLVTVAKQDKVLPDATPPLRQLQPDEPEVVKASVEVGVKAVTVNLESQTHRVLVVQGVKQVSMVRVTLDTAPTVEFQLVREAPLLVLSMVGAGWLKVQICMLQLLEFLICRLPEMRELLQGALLMFLMVMAREAEEGMPLIVKYCCPKLVLKVHDRAPEGMEQIGEVANKFEKVVCRVEFMTMKELSGRRELERVNVAAVMSPTQADYDDIEQLIVLGVIVMTPVLVKGVPDAEAVT